MTIALPASPALRFERLLWWMPAAFALHIVEEASGGFTRYVVDAMHGMPMPTLLFFVNNAVFMLILLTLCIRASRRPTRRSAFALMSWASANLFWDFLVHLAYTVQSGQFSPGLVSATLLYVPVSLVVSAAALRDGRLSLAEMLLAYTIGALLMGLVLWGGIYHFAA